MYKTKFQYLLCERIKAWNPTGFIITTNLVFVLYNDLAIAIRKILEFQLGYLQMMP